MVLERLPLSDWLGELHCPQHKTTALELVKGQAVCKDCASAFSTLQNDIIDLVAEELLDEDARRELEEHSYEMTAAQIASWVLSERANLWKNYYTLDRQPGIKKLAKYLGPKPKDQLYFLGAGTGREIEYLLQYVSFDRIICSDIAAPGLSVIPIRLASYRIKLGLFTSDLNHCPVTDRSASVVVVNALHHTGDMHQVLATMLEYGYAQICLVEPTDNFLIRLLEKAGLARRVEYSGVKPGRLNIGRLRKLCVENGYELEITTMWSFPQDYYKKAGIKSDRVMRGFLGLVRLFSVITSVFNFGNSAVVCMTKGSDGRH